jgi:hypothetical protein
MTDTISDLARHLAANTEAVCRFYLSKGHREGRYWLVGDVHNTPGRSLYVRLCGSLSGKGAAGKWVDAATGEHGDLLDLIAAAHRFDGISATVDEAQRFLGIVRATPNAFPPRSGSSATPAATGSPEAARRLFRMSRPMGGTLASTYLLARGIVSAQACPALRFHPRCWYRPDRDDPPSAGGIRPALIAAVTDQVGCITGVQRTWLDSTGRTKALIATPRRAMGSLLGHAVRFGAAGDVMAVGEGIETMLSLHRVLPALPLAAALTATHLAAVTLPSELRRLYIARDNDPAGYRAVAALTARARAAGIETVTLAPALSDFNDDLRQFGADGLAEQIRPQLVPQDVTRFWAPGDGGPIR